MIRTPDRRPAADNSSTQEAPPSVFVVSGPQGVDQVFALQLDARQYADGIVGARVSSHALRSSIERAAIVIDRRIVVKDGGARTERTSWTRCFDDDPYFEPVTADVEWFRNEAADEWHIVGFGTDEVELGTKIEAALKEVDQGSRATWAGETQLCG